jgi:hypothetical protein
MIKLRSIINPLTRLKKQVDSCARAFQLGRISIHDCIKETPRHKDVVVSLTSIPSRLGIVHLTIRSLFAQSHLPRKIILWLHEDLRTQIPRALSSLENEVFEIRYNELNCSHRKLVSSLEFFPEDCIVTCDDDSMYDTAWLENLYASHVLHPVDVIGGKCRRISYNGSGELMPYKKWHYSYDRGGSEPCLMAVGFGGTLYPPHCMMKDVTDPKLFLELAPRADDLWFKAMALLNGVNVRTSLVPSKDPVEINRSQKNALRRLNIREDGNHRQWTDICNHYKIKPEQVTGAIPTHH